MSRQPSTDAAKSAPGPGYRLRRYVDRYGWKSLLPWAAHAVRQLLFLDETHVWYERRLDENAPHIDLPAGFTLSRADAATVKRIETLPTVSLAEAQRRLANGNDLWFVWSGDQPAFACWIFRRAMPMLSAPGGAMTAPEGAVFLEDSVTGADFRGRGLAPAAWSLLAQSLMDEGMSSILTKVGEANVASRKAVGKAGFTEIGTMRFRRVLGHRRTQMTATANTTGERLAWQLEQTQQDRGR